MKINRNDFLAFKFKDSFSAIIERYHNDIKTKNISSDLTDDEFMQRRKEFFAEIISEKNNKFYYLTNTVKEISDKVKVGNNFNYTLLNTIDNKKCTYIPDKNRFFRFRKTDDNLYVLFVEFNTETDYISYNSFRVDIINNKVYNADFQSFKILEELVKYLIFIELSDVELKLLLPNNKIGSLKKGDAIKNLTKIPITIVDSDWNKIIVRSEGFNVSGHLRLQACGYNLSERKLLWINPYEKKGYIRGLKNI